MSFILPAIDLPAMDLPAIDWSRPWFGSVRHIGERLAETRGWRAALNLQAEIIDARNHRDLPIRFVEHVALPPDMAYEAFIGATGKVPTRDNAHDFFNALVWLSFPAIKRELNALQVAQIASMGIARNRGSVRDAATLFDENAALLVVRDDTRGQSLVEALRSHAWHQLFVAQREVFSNSVDVWLFGHALMEKLLNPYKAITAHAWPVFAPDDFFALAPAAKRQWLDTQVAEQLRQLGGALQPGCFTPLPVLGISGWWPDQDAEFYADASVFRPKRTGS